MKSRSTHFSGTTNLPRRRARIGQQARLAAERRFSWTAIQDEAYRSYLQVLERKGARAPRAAVGD